MLLRKIQNLPAVEVALERANDQCSPYESGLNKVVNVPVANSRFQEALKKAMAGQ